MNSLLDDIEADHHADLLANGNLKPKPRDLIPRWHSEGYIARLLTTKCRCGKTYHSLAGIFHREADDNGAIRDERLDETKLLQFSYESLTTIDDTHAVGICIACLPLHHAKAIAS